MTIINISVPFGFFNSIDDYSKLINDILKHEVSVNILKFTTGTSGVNLLINIPEDKIKEITEDLEKNNVIVSKEGRISLNRDKCINCGACVSLCPTEALHFDSDDTVDFSKKRCIGCLVCIDSCPRQALKENT